MTQLFIPSGEIEFHGNLEQLLQSIQKVNGTLMAGQQFRCSIPYPKHNGLKISFIRRPFVMPGCQFHCKYEATPSGFRIIYQVWPAFLSLFFILMPTVMAVASCVQYHDNAKGFYPILIALMVTIVLGCLFLLERREHIARFLEAFSS